MTEVAVADQPGTVRPGEELDPARLAAFLSRHAETMRELSDALLADAPADRPSGDAE